MKCQHCLVRQKIVTEIVNEDKNVPWKSFVHPSAVISSSSTIGKGTVVMAGAMVNADTSIGDHVIINTGATVDHDCVIGDFVHIAPGVHLAGGVSVGTGTLLGIGSCAIPYTQIGEWVTVGAGATVTSNISEKQVFVGTPARPLNK